MTSKHIRPQCISKRIQNPIHVIIASFGLFFLLLFIVTCNHKPSGSSSDVGDTYTGSASCIECHEQFYTLWAPSYHGLAMQPITAEFIQKQLLLNQEGIVMEGATYQAIQKETSLIIQERKANETKDYPVLWALGGKNVYYFLTEWEGGRLQTLPLAYDVHTKLWYNNPASAVRHFPTMMQGGMADSALSWRDREYTFNTSCYSCHVSQLKNNFDLATNTYQTHWKEVGINCETCHGPAQEHIIAARIAKEKGVELDSVKLIVTKTFTPEQHNSSCAPCHAKMQPITSSYTPGDRFYDNFDLITLENTDFYPDGRDLGENYTMTSWAMNSCIQNSPLHCVTCHTSSGRYRFKNDNPVEANKACTTCHEDNGKNYEIHTHHLPDNNSPTCVQCHMPTTRFGNMNRSDHSFRPPMPAATITFSSANACNLCHTDKSPEWANKNVKSWHKQDYQKETLYIGTLIDEARGANWKRVDEMLKAIQTNQYGDIFTNSLIRILTNCDNQKKWPILIEAMNLSSPLLRSSAALGLLGHQNEEAKLALFTAAKDAYRLVRLAAAQSLAFFPQSEFTPEQSALFRKVNVEYETSLVSRPDDWSAYYNLGNHYQNMGNPAQALSAYNNSLKIYPEAIMSLINSSFLYSVSGNQPQAIKNLQKALSVEPENEAANLNYALLMAEMKRMDESEKSFRTVLKVNPKNSTAAYNLSVLVSSRDLNESCTLSKQAMEATPDDPKFAYTYAYFLHQNKQHPAAISQLEKTIKKFPGHISSVFLLGNIYVTQGQKDKVIDLYTKTMAQKTIDTQTLELLRNEILQIKAIRN